MSYWSHDEIPVKVSLPPDWLCAIAAPVRRFVTRLTLYPLSRRESVVPDGRVSTWR
ncbi:hypothetical protein [Amycolatopsis decaplanina]|uniref:hypothetical protein n=1 Tax=Amycolatopsis decaplanina TaxID=208441 RepID=UPI001F2A766A|nr:hypothetical protein [Amycolatopsis decaplanina]